MQIYFDNMLFLQCIVFLKRYTNFVGILHAFSGNKLADVQARSIFCQIQSHIKRNDDTILQKIYFFYTKHINNRSICGTEKG